MSNENTPRNAGEECDVCGFQLPRCGCTSTPPKCNCPDSYSFGHEPGCPLLADNEAQNNMELGPPRTTPPTQSQEGETVDYSAPTPETDAFMSLINDSEIDLGQVEAKLRQFESERNAAQRENDRLRSEVAGLKADRERLDWLDEDRDRAAQTVDTSRLVREAIDAARVATEEGKRG